jgi:hypothetical protein
VVVCLTRGISLRWFTEGTTYEQGSPTFDFWADTYVALNNAAPSAAASLPVLILSDSLVVGGRCMSMWSPRGVSDSYLIDENTFSIAPLLYILAFKGQEQTRRNQMFRLQALRSKIVGCMYWVDILLSLMHACIYVWKKSGSSTILLLCISFQSHEDLVYACSELRHRFKSETDVNSSCRVLASVQRGSLTYHLTSTPLLQSSTHSILRPVIATLNL